jgi:hypothetical protein
MSFSNIQSVTKTADASAVTGRTRLLGVYFTNTATASSFSLKDGTTDSGTAKLTINTPAVAGAQDLMIPDMGIVFENGIYVDVNDVEVTSVTLLFEGGAAA